MWWLDSNLQFVTPLTNSLFRINFGIGLATRFQRRGALLFQLQKSGSGENRPQR